MRTWSTLTGKMAIARGGEASRASWGESMDRDESLSWINQFLAYWGVNIDDCLTPGIKLRHQSTLMHFVISTNWPRCYAPNRITMSFFSKHSY